MKSEIVNEGESEDISTYRREIAVDNLLKNIEKNVGYAVSFHGMSKTRESIMKK